MLKNKIINSYQLLWFALSFSTILSPMLYANSKQNISEVEKLASLYTVENFINKHSSEQPLTTYWADIQKAWGKLVKHMPFFSIQMIFSDDESNYSANASEYRDTLAQQVPDIARDIDKLNRWLKQVPVPDTIDSTQTPDSQYVHTMISGGNMRPYSKAIAYNHAAFAVARNINYVFVPFEKQATLPISIDVLKFLGRPEPGTGLPVQPYWGKIYLLDQIINKQIPKGKWVVWLDDDVTINDFTGEPMFDRLIKSATTDTCILTAQDYWKAGFKKDIDDHLQNNTGIILIQNTDDCKALLSRWLDKHQDGVLGRKSQEHTLHEQSALSQMVLSTVTAVQKNENEYFFRYEHQSVGFGALSSRFNFPHIDKKEIITIMKNRTQKWNFNTFKRFSFYSLMNTGKTIYIDYNADIDRNLAALPGDAFVHHTGMLPLQKLALIAHSLHEIRDSYPLSTE